MSAAGFGEREWGTYRAYCDVGKSEEIELVHAWNDYCPQQPQHPCPKCACRHVGVVGVGDGRADFGIWGIVLCKVGDSVGWDDGRGARD